MRSPQTCDLMMIMMIMMMMMMMMMNFQLNKQMLASQHEQQLGVFIQQMGEQRRRGQGEAGERLERPPPPETKFRLDILKQKSKPGESAMASPEVST